MKRTLYLVKYFIFWIFVALLMKSIFLLWNIEECNALSGGDIWGIYLHGFSMDMSFAGYMAGAGALLGILCSIISAHYSRKFFNILTAILLAIVIIVSVVDMEIFANWGTHSDASPLGYLKTPGAAMASTTPATAVILIGIMVVAWIVCWFLYRRFLRFPNQEGRPLRYLIGSIVMAGLLFIPIRGGFNVAPMNSGFCYFHPTSNFANQAAVNGVWNFIYEVTHMDKGKVLKFMEQQEAEAIVASTCFSSDSCTNILKSDRPNVVILLMESFTSKAIGVLGGDSLVTPNLNKLASEGVLFYNIYGTAMRSDRGLAGVISGQPSHYKTAIVKFPEKAMKKPSFIKKLGENGYTTAFYYAGDMNFGNFKSYARMSFDKLIDENAFSGEAIQNRFKWGVHDEYTYEKALQDMKSEQEPFCYMIYNLTSHEPFIVPTDHRFPGESREEMFKSAIYYTDSCLGRFIDGCKAEGLYENTLFVLVADHSTIHIGDNKDVNDPEVFKIPVLLFGGAVGVKDSVVYSVGSQIDVAKTVLAQMNIDGSDFQFSKNLLADSVSQFAYFSNTVAAAVVTEHGNAIYDIKGGKTIIDTNSFATEALKAWLQVVDNDIR